jgi:hypothetical protein
MMDQRVLQDACMSVQEKFLQLFDGELPMDEKARVEDHLRLCASCSRHWKGYLAVVQALRDLEEMEVPATVLEGIRKRLHRKSLLDRVLEWTKVAPLKIPAPALAASIIVAVGLVLWQLYPMGSTRGPSPPTQVASTPIEAPGLTLASSAFPGEDMMAFLKKFDIDVQWPGVSKTAIQDEMILDLSGSEEIFEEIESILQESKGKVFIVGLRNRASGEVLRSHVLIEVPLANYQKVVQKIESLGPVRRVFLEKEAIPPRPDRLRITLIARESMDQYGSFTLKEATSR